MAGLMGAMAPAQNQPPQQGNKTPPQKPSRKNTAGTGTQEQYKVVSGMMLKALYSERWIKMVQERLQGDPVNGLGSLIGRLMTTAAQSAVMQTGSPVPPEVLFMAGMELSKAIGELVVKMGVPAGQEAGIVEDAFFAGVQLFAQEAGEEALSQEERQAYVALLDRVEQAKGGKPQPQQETA